MRFDCLAVWVFSAVSLTLSAQTLVNVDFGVGQASAKAGRAATGWATNDFWNLHRHYAPRVVPGTPPVADGRTGPLRDAAGGETGIVVAVTNAPGVWGNASGDPMWDTYLYAPNGSNIVVVLTGLVAGRYHLYAYGHADADADAAGDQDSVFTLTSGTNRLGPLTTLGGGGWRAGEAMVESRHVVVFRDVPVAAGDPLVLEVAPGPRGIAVLNGLQVLSRGTRPPRRPDPAVVLTTGPTNLWIREVNYQGILSDHEARFRVTVDAESPATNEVSGLLFEGDVAVFPEDLPAGWRVVRTGAGFGLAVTMPGRHTLRFDVLAKTLREPPWNRVTFRGPPAGIATVTATSSSPEVDVELLAGTPSAEGRPSAEVSGVIGSDRQVAVRWQARMTEVTRAPRVAVETAVAIEVTPAVVRHVTQLRYDVLQAPLASTRIGLAPGHALTRVEGDSLREWRLVSEGEGRVVEIDFLRPVEGETRVRLTTEQPLPELPGSLVLSPPHPLGAQRESGAMGVVLEDLVLRVEDPGGLRQVNPAGSEVAAFRYFGSAPGARVRIERLQPEVSVATRVTALVEESRMVVTNHLDVEVTRAGLFGLDLKVPSGLGVSAVRAEGLEDWQVSGEGLRLAFRQRVLGRRGIEVELERSMPPTMTNEVELAAVRVDGAAQETVRVAWTAAPGHRVRTVSMEGVREVPAGEAGDEVLVFAGRGGDWRIGVAVERLASRVIAEVVHLVTIGEGYVGGSATVRYGILNQGVQQLRLRLPAHWRNVEFTGPGLRRRDRDGEDWTLALQDKVWGAYTLVVTFDHPLDPEGGTVEVAGAQPLGAERVAGYVAITSASGLGIAAEGASETLRPADPAELPEADRALIDRPVLLAYRSTGPEFALRLRATRHEEAAVLDAVADRTALTTVVTEGGEVLTQAAFLVKNNDRQFQRFRLSPGAELWGVSVNGEPVKAERDGDWLLVSLPRTANRDETFAVDLKYAENLGALRRFMPQSLRLQAPATDVPSTYAEWEVFVPESRRLGGFGGSMVPLAGTTYGLRDAWDKCLAVYRGLWLDYGPGAIVVGCGVVFLGALVWAGRRRGFPGVTQVVVVLALVGILLSMLLPALSKAKSKALTIKAVNQMKQIGIAARVWSSAHGDRLPSGFSEIAREAGAEGIFVNPANGRFFTYLGAGRSVTDPHAILAFGETEGGRFVVAMADGSVQVLGAREFQDAVRRSGVDLARVGLEDGLLRRYGLVPGEGTAAGAPPEPGLAKAGEDPGAGASRADAEVTAPKAVGLRSLRFEIPRTGRAYHFTKVLNVRGEPLTMEGRLVRGRVAAACRMVFEVGAFLGGLGLILWQWRAASPRAVGLAAGAAMVIVSTASLFLAWRALHLVLIFGAPLAVFLLGGNLVWAWQRRRRERRVAQGDGGPSLPPALPGSAVATGLVLASLSLVQAPGAVRAETGMPAVTVTVAEFTGDVQGTVARLEGVLRLVSVTTNEAIALFGPEVAVESLVSPRAGVRAWRAGTSWGVVVPEAGETEVRLGLLVRTEGEGNRRRLAFGVPRALATRLRLGLEEADAEVDFPTAVAMERKAEGGRTWVSGVLGTADRVDLTWAPRVQRVAEDEATVLAEVTALVTVGAGAVNTKATLNYQVVQGELRELRVRLPEGHRLVRVGGEGIRDWDVSSDGAGVRVGLVKGTRTGVVVDLESEGPLGDLPALVTVRVPEAQGVRRATGVIGVRGTEETAVTVDRAGGVRRVEPSELPRLSGLPEGEVVAGAYRFDGTSVDLRLRADEVRPEIEAVTRQAWTVARDETRLLAEVEYQVRRLGVFRLRLRLPEGFVVEEVQCPAMRQWTEEQDAVGRHLDVALRQRTQGMVRVRVRLRQGRVALPEQLELTGLEPAGARSAGAWVSVGAEAGVGIKTVGLEGLVEIPVANLPPGDWRDRGALLAFKRLAAGNGDTGAPGRLHLATEVLASWVRVEVAHRVTISESLVEGRSLLRYDVQNAPTREFRFTVPPGWRNVEVLGSEIRRREVHGTNVAIELQAPRRGEYTLAVHWEEPRTGGTNAWRLAGFSVGSVERESGFLAVSARPPLQVDPGPGSGDFRRLDSAELPAWVGLEAGGGGAGRGTVLAWRYLRPGGEFALGIQRFDDAAVLQALVETVRLTSAVAHDGQVMTRLQLAVRNNGRQHVAVALPEGATVWTAFVGHQPVRPGRRDGRLLLPLEGSGDPDVPVPIEVTYVSEVRFPRVRGAVRLEAPRLDLPLKDARWEVYLPPDYEYRDFGGSMTHTVTDLAPVAQEFTLAEYQRQEAAKEDRMAEEIRQVVARARGKLAAGRYGEVKEELGAVRGRSVQDVEAARAVQQLEEEFSRVQSSNFLQAQQAHLFDNARRLDVPLEGLAGGRAGVPGADEGGAAGGSVEARWSEAAQRQVEVVRKAQAVSAGRVQPLRVNLPTRGLRHAFSQVLLTEVNTPLTVEFSVAHLERRGTFRRLATWGVGFLGLWLAAGIVTFFHGPRAEVATERPQG